MKLKEYKSNGTKWVHVGDFNDVTEDQVKGLVEQWLVEGTKLVLVDQDGDFIKEWVN